MRISCFQLFVKLCHSPSPWVWNLKITMVVHVEETVMELPIHKQIWHGVGFEQLPVGQVEVQCDFFPQITSCFTLCPLIQLLQPTGHAHRICPQQMGSSNHQFGFQVGKRLPIFGGKGCRGVKAKVISYLRKCHWAFFKFFLTPANRTWPLLSWYRPKFVIPRSWRKWWEI